MEATEIKRRLGAGKLKLTGVKKICVRLALSASGLLLCRVSFDGKIFPFGFALAGGATDKYFVFTCLGSVLGALIFCPHISALKYISASVLLFFLRFALSKKVKSESELWLKPLLTFLTLLAGSLSVFLIEEPTASVLVPEICDSVIAGAASLFSHRLFTLLSQESLFSGITAGDSAAVMLWGSLLMLSLDSFFGGGFSPARLLSFTVLMLISYLGRESFGIMAGVCTGVVFGLSQGAPHLLFALPLGGLICTLCSEYGKIAVATGFAVSGTLALIIKGNPDTALISGGEILGAAMLFSLIPKRLMGKIKDKIMPFSADEAVCEAGRVLNMRIKRSSSAVREVASSVEAVCRALSRTQRADIHDIPQSVKEDVCTDCLKKDFCWNSSPSATSAAFSQCLSLLGTNGRLTTDKLPERLEVVCREKNALADSFNRCFCEHNARITVRNEIFETKALAAAQFRCAADIMDDASLQATAELDTDTRLTALFTAVFTLRGFDCISLCVSNVKQQRCLIEVLLRELPHNPNYNGLIQSLEAKSGIVFMPPIVQELKSGECLLSFCEKTALGVKYHKLSRTGDGEKHCGDCCEAFADGKGNFYCVLSDGMGTGARAALDSSMSCSLFSKMMKAGFAAQTAFSAVNSALAVKSADESLATLDCLHLDLYTGEGEIYKAGGAFSVLFKNGSVSVIQQASMPLGILRETRFEKNTISLQKGDGVLMLSDGAMCLKPSFFRELFSSNTPLEPAVLCEKAVEAAVGACASGKIDDITVACVLAV